MAAASSSTLLGRQQQAGLVRDHDLARAVDVVADHRLAGDQRLRQHPGQPFAQAGVHDDVHRADQRRNLLRRHQPRELKVRFQAGAAHLIARIWSDRMPSPTNRNRTFGLRSHDLLRRAHDVLVALKMKQPGDLADDDVLVAIAELPADVAARCSSAARNGSTSMPL